MNLVDLLKSQHREVMEMLERLGADEATSDRKQRKTMLAEVAPKVRAHMLCEEKLIYPLAARTLEDDTIVLESIEEHATAKLALELLENTSTGDKRFAARAKVLLDLVQHHAEEEEQQLLPDLERHLAAPELDKLGARFEQRFEAMVAEGGGMGGMRRAPAGRAARGRTSRGTTARASGGARATTKRGTTKRGPTKRAPETTRATAKRGTAKRGTAKRGTAKRGTAKRGAAKRGAASTARRATSRPRANGGAKTPPARGSAGSRTPGRPNRGEAAGRG